MPTIVRLCHGIVYIYAGDHNPPHFHYVTFEGGEVMIGIEDLRVLKGRIARRALCEALGWAEANHETLKENWMWLNGDER